MLTKLMPAVVETYSGAMALDHVASISRCHRIQASPGFRAAAGYCLDQLRQSGVAAEIVSFPADEHTTYWTARMFQEWEATEATLDLLLPTGERQRLADYRQDKISLIQRSLPFDGQAELVVVEGGAAEADYQGLDLKGKVVLAQGEVREVYRLAVQERGAVGILIDGMRSLPPVRQRIDLPDARQYTSFWWREGDEPRCFGFVLTPRQGDELRARAREAGQKGQGALRIQARVVSRLYDGQLEVVSALIPGETDQEAVAHLCHPQASANDNASGAAALLELARTLSTLLADRRLSVPRRSIRLLWVPEMTGTYAYLATHEEELARMVAGINLDMVGQNQELCGCVFLIERPPEAAASFAGDLAEALREMLPHAARSHSGLAGYPLHRQAVTPFSGGSDHYILSDPTVGVPTPMLIQWPDKFYHTSADTIDKVDPRMLAVVGGLTTAYTYFVAAAGQAEARWLGREVVARGQARLARLAQEAHAQALGAEAPALAAIAAQTRRRLAFWADRTEAALGSLSRLAEGLEAAIEQWQALEAELGRLARAAGAELSEPAPAAPDEWAAQAERLVLRRLVRGPVSLGDLVGRLSPADQALARDLTRAHPEAMRTLPVQMVYWLDGRRTLRQVADLVECESGLRDLECMVQVAGILERAGLLERISG